MLFGWQLYFGELDGGGAEGDGTGRDEETGQRGGDMSRVDMDMEYGWRLYFNELPGHGEADAAKTPAECAQERAGLDESAGRQARHLFSTDSGATGDTSASTPPPASLEPASAEQCPPTASAPAEPLRACVSVQAQACSGVVWEAQSAERENRRPSDVQELIDFGSPPYRGDESAAWPLKAVHTRAFSRLKAAFLDEGLLFAEAETLAQLTLEGHCPLEWLTSDLQMRVLLQLDLLSLLRCAEVSRNWNILARHDYVWGDKCRLAGWVEGSRPCALSSEVGRDGGLDVGGMSSKTWSEFERYWGHVKRRLWSWGMGEHGQLGVVDSGGKMVNCSARPREVMALRGLGVVRVACGAAHSVCVVASGAVFTWGCGKYGRLGHGSETTVYEPQRVEALAHTRCCFIACGGAHNLAVAAELRGSSMHAVLYTWGSNIHGECGVGQSKVSVNDRVGDRQRNEGSGRGVDNRQLSFLSEPQQNELVAGHMIQRIECGSSHSLILLTTGLVLAFGRGEFGQQGNGAFDDVNVPCPVALFDCGRPEAGAGKAGPVARDIAAGAEHCFVVDVDGGLWGWGWNVYGQLGPVQSASEDKVCLPERVSLPSDVVQASGGHVHSAVVTSCGSILTFGLDRLPHGGGGRLGLGKHVSTSRQGLRDASIAPTRIENIPADSRAAAVTCGSDHSVALLLPRLSSPQSAAEADRGAAGLHGDSEQGWGRMVATEVVVTQSEGRGPSWQAKEPSQQQGPGPQHEARRTSAPESEVLMWGICTESRDASANSELGVASAPVSLQLPQPLETDASKASDATKMVDAGLGGGGDGRVRAPAEDGRALIVVAFAAGVCVCVCVRARARVLACVRACVYMDILAQKQSHTHNARPPTTPPPPTASEGGEHTNRKARSRAATQVTTTRWS